MQAALSIAPDIFSILSFVETNCGSTKVLEIETTDADDSAAAEELVAAALERAPEHVVPILRMFSVALNEVAVKIQSIVLSKTVKASAAALSAVQN